MLQASLFPENCQTTQILLYWPFKGHWAALAAVHLVSLVHLAGMTLLWTMVVTMVMTMAITMVMTMATT